MGKYDKDRYLKELAVRFCIAQGALPFLEVAVASTSELSDATETLTDIDVLGVMPIQDGSLRRTLFDCKSQNKMSPINRVFWAAGLLRFTGGDDGYVILKNRAVHNHRMSALSMGLDLHDEASFKQLGASFDVGFDKDVSYQSSIARWNSAYDCYINNKWSEPLFLIARNLAPLSRTPWNTFRRLIADLTSAKGEFDPKKDPHLFIYLDLVSSAFLLWTTIGRDIRRFYDPSMNRDEFERILRYYVWGGRDSYLLRTELREKMSKKGDIALDIPEWGKFLSLVGLIIDAPHDIFPCANFCRELAFRFASGASDELDKPLVASVRARRRLRQFTLALSGYLVVAAGLPQDINRRIEDVLLNW